MSISDDLSSTVEALDRLLEPQRLKKARDLDALAAIVAGLDESWGAEDEIAIVDLRPGAPPAARRGSQPDPGEERPGDVPPTRDGHPWGPSMRERFIREALRKPSW